MTRLRIVDSPADIAAARWDTLAAGNSGTGSNPFMSHAFLSALIETGCASPRSGWTARFLLIERDGEAVAAMPLFVKTHSFGEYVFDWSWADAYAKHGLAYYPKSLCAVPFTPVEGPRLLARERGDRDALLAAALELARETSSFHLLFAGEEDMDVAREQGLLTRRSVQFHWRNEGYADFASFLGRMSHARRKNIKQERRRVRESGVTFRRLRGREIEPAHWEFFHRCYRSTYAAHGSSPYLSLRFFQQLGATLPDNMLLFLAERESGPIAASLCIADERRLYGRHWGALQHVPLLHFECCYYQPIEYAIEQGLQVFEGGAQGEHKIFRGLLPVETHSAHWLAHPGFARAIGEHLSRE
ncbi:MAG: GNAT family N-acetyltransferase, partial [Betaproteobacteria bacterium]|nr:GNAT family N-acetyltransferase [Betaproteobacteria bacterium]